MELNLTESDYHFYIAVAKLKVLDDGLAEEEVEEVVEVEEVEKVEEEGEKKKEVGVEEKEGERKREKGHALSSVHTEIHTCHVHGQHATHLDGVHVSTDIM